MTGRDPRLLIHITCSGAYRCNRHPEKAMPPIHPLSSTPMAGALIMHPHRYSLLCVLSCTHMPTQAYVNVYVCAIYACVCVHAGSACCVTLHEAAQGARRRVTGAYEYLAASSSADMPSGVLAFASAFFCRAGGARQVCVCVCVRVCAHMNAANPTDFAHNTHGTPKGKTPGAKNAGVDTQGTVQDTDTDSEC